MYVDRAPSICEGCPVTSCAVRGQDQSLGHVAVECARNLRREHEKVVGAITGTPLPNAWLGGRNMNIVPPAMSQGARLALQGAIISARMAAESLPEVVGRPVQKSEA